MKVLVTGASGLLGRHLLERIRDRHELVALSRRPPGGDAAEDVEWIGVDLASMDTGSLPERIDAVVHVAQSERYREFPEAADDIFAVNVEATHRLLEYARNAGAERFVLASTGGVYAHADEPVSETAPLACPGPYFRSKRMAELLLADYEELMSTFILRPFFIYGPGGRLLVTRLAANVLEGQTIEIEGDPGLAVNPIHAADAAAAFAAALEAPEGGIFNVAGDEVVTITGLVELIAEVAGREADISHTGGAPPGDLVADTSRMRESLGVSCEVSLRAGITTVLEDFRARTPD